MSIAHIAESQSLSPSALVELYTLDTSALLNIYGQGGQGPIYNWTPGTLNGGTVAFDGVTYAPMPIEASGFEWSGQGTLPQPKLKLSNVGGLATGLIIQFGDMLGAQVTRLRTFIRFLDGQPGADPSAVFTADVFRIDRKSHHSKAYVEFELAAAIDQMGVKLPKRQALADACGFTYRVSRNGGWRYGTCPYAGTGRFDAGDQVVTSDTLDVCSHRLTGCLARYGQSAPLPFGGFPGVAQVIA